MKRITTFAEHFIIIEIVYTLISEIIIFGLQVFYSEKN